MLFCGSLQLSFVVVWNWNGCHPLTAAPKETIIDAVGFQGFFWILSIDSSKEAQSCSIKINAQREFPAICSQWQHFVWCNITFIKQLNREVSIVTLVWHNRLIYCCWYGDTFLKSKQYLWDQYWFQTKTTAQNVAIFWELHVKFLIDMSFPWTVSVSLIITFISIQCSTITSWICEPTVWFLMCFLCLSTVRFFNAADVEKKINPPTYSHSL